MPQASDFKPSKLFSLGDDDEPETGIPVRMVGTWTDSVRTKPGEVSQRGFGGRLLFYGNKSDKPILVDGQLVVYAFDETGRSPTDNKPTRRYVFPADQIPLHMSESEIGASYSFWLPWDEVGGPQTEVSLICRFEPKDGAVIASEQTKHRLPGELLPESKVADGNPPKLPEGVPFRPAQPTLESIQQSRIVDHNTQLASYESVMPLAGSDGAAAAAGSPHPQQRMTTTSIALPRHYQFPVLSAASQPATPASSVSPHALQPATQSQSQRQLAPIQPQLPAATAAPAMTPLPMTAPPMTSAMPTQATPQIRPGFGAYPTPPISTQPAFGGFSMPAAGPTLSTTHGRQPRTVQWNTVQQAPAQSQTPQQVIVQPASQPLPPPTGITTTVSYSMPQ
jgi:hypothetical protein